MNSEQYLNFVKIDIFSFKKWPGDLQTPLKNSTSSVSRKSIIFHPRTNHNNPHPLNLLMCLLKFHSCSRFPLMSPKRKSLLKAKRQRKSRRKALFRNRRSRARQGNPRKRWRKWATNQRLRHPVFCSSSKISRAISLRPIPHMESLSWQKWRQNCGLNTPLSWKRHILRCAINKEDYIRNECKNTEFNFHKKSQKRKKTDSPKGSLRTAIRKPQKKRSHLLMPLKQNLTLKSKINQTEFNPQ